MVGWGLIWLIILMIRLRNVEAHDDHLLIKSLLGVRKVNYQDIQYVTELAMVNPRLISVKYRDTRAGTEEKILIMPPPQQEFTLKMRKEHEMTKFIRRQILKTNPFYSVDNEPSRWAAARVIILTGIPVIVYVNFLFFDAIKF